MATPTRSVNLADLGTLKRDYPVIADCLVLPCLTAETVQHDASRFDEVALLVKPDVSDEQWQAVIKILREGLGRYPGTLRNLLRIYVGHKRV